MAPHTSVNVVCEGKHSQDGRIATYTQQPHTQLQELQWTDHTTEVPRKGRNYLRGSVVALGIAKCVRRQRTWVARLDRVAKLAVWLGYKNRE